MKDYVGEPTHCCLMMDLAIDEGYLIPTIAMNFEKGTLDIHPPRIEGKKVGRKQKPGMLLNYCPWCAKKLTKDEPVEHPDGE